MSYLKLHTFLLDWFDNDPIINTIANDKEEQIDSNVNNIYPICNFYISDYGNGQYNDYTVLITLLDQVDIIPKVNNSKLIDATNHADIVNELEQVMDRFLIYLRERNNDELVSTLNVGRVGIIKGSDKSGVQCEITFEVHNEVLNY